MRGGGEEAGSFADPRPDSSRRGTRVQTQAAAGPASRLKPPQARRSHALQLPVHRLQMLQRGSKQCNNINPQKGGQRDNSSPES